MSAVLQTQDDKEVRFYDDLLKDKTVLINFMWNGGGVSGLDQTRDDGPLSLLD